MGRIKVLPVGTVSKPAQSDTLGLNVPASIWASTILLGDCGVGKTSLLQRMQGIGGSSNETRSRRSVVNASVTRGKAKANLSLNDTGGQEKFRSLTASYYRGAHGCLLLFDVTNETTFKNVAYWLYDLREHSTHPEVCTILVGTRCHVPKEERAVLTERAEKFAESEGLTYMEVSAEEGINVTEVFEKMADLIIEKLAKNQLIITQPKDKETVTIRKSQKPTKKEICAC